MKLNEYVKGANKTINYELSEDERMLQAAMGMTGEAAEVMDIIKKARSHIFIIVMTVIHMVTGSILNLADDGAYYWVWSRHLDISYYDHPPMIAYLIKIFTSIFGNNNFAVRLVPVLSVMVTSIYIYKIIKYLYNDEKKAFTAVVIYNIIPLFSMTSILVLPDLPLIMFYTAGLYYFLRIIYEKKAKLWYLLAILTGLGLLSKYNMFLVYPGIFFYLLLNSDDRYWLKRKEPYIAFIVSVLFFLPVLIWNYNHEWISFAFHLYNRHSHELTLKPDLFLLFILVQMIIVSPVIFIGFWTAIFNNFSRKDVRILFFYGMPVFLIFMLASLVTEFKVHWTAMAYIPFLIIFAAYNKWNRIWKYSGIVLAIIFSLFFYVQSFYPFLKIDPHSDITTDFHGWDMVGREVGEIYKNLNKDEWFLFSSRYQVASQLYFYLPEENYVYSLNNKIEQYDFWQKEEGLKDKNGLFVTHSFYRVLPGEKYNFSDIELVKKINVIRAGEIYRTFYIYKCYNYQGVK